MTGDFTIETPNGETLRASFIEGRIGIYNGDQLIAVVPADLDYVEPFGKIKAPPHIRARLILERGTSTPEY